MALQELYAAMSAAGYRVNEQAGTVDGVTHGIAWRFTPGEEALDMSVSVSEKTLQSWQNAFAGGSVAYRGFGVRLTAAGLAAMAPDALLSWIDGWTAYAAEAAGASFDDSFARYRESPSAYFRGAAGALLGALVGVLPWVLTGLLGWQLWIFGVLISIASFYGYQWLRGAHATRFAVTVIIASSLLAVLLGQMAGTVLNVWLNSETAVTFWEALRACWNPAGWLYVLRHSVFALCACALGFVGIRGKVMNYTHESGFLRGRGRWRRGRK